MTIRIAIAEDHRVVADALATMLGFEDELEIVGFVGTGDEVVALAEREQPDVVIMDLSMPGGDGVDATRRVLDASSSTRVLVLTMHDDPDHVGAAIAAGATGYLPKNTARAELIAAVRAVAAGEGYLHPSVTRPFLDRVAPTADPGRLSPREQEVLTRLADGMSTREIASALTVSDETVKTHLTRIYQKLGVSDRVQAVAAALRRGLVE